MSDVILCVMKKVASLFIVLLLSVFLFSSSVFALNFFENITVNVTEPAKDDLYILGGEVTIEQKVFGDVVALGGTVDIFGDVAGDVIAAGGKVSIHGNVGDDVRAAGGVITVNGNVNDDVVVTSGTVDISRSASVSGTVFLKAGMVTIDGNVHENVIGKAGVLKIRGWIDGDIEVFASELLSFSSSARVKGNLKYYSKNPALIPDGVVNGRIEKTASLFGTTQMLVAGFYTKARLLVAIWMFLSLTLIGLLFSLLLPKEMIALSDEMREEFWRRMGMGFVIVVVLPVSAFLIALTAIGLPLAAILLFAAVIVWMISQVAVGLFVGNLLLRKVPDSRWRIFGKMTLGLFVYTLVAFIPVVGPLVAFALSLVAFATFLVRRYEMIKFLKTKRYWGAA